MPVISVNNVKFNYELLGKADASQSLVLISGYACDIEFWKPFAKMLENDFSVLIFDNQGIGKTEDDGKPLSIDIMSKNIKMLIDKLQLENPIVAGFAMGGIIAQKLALDFPTDIKQLILLNSVAEFSEKAKNLCEQFCVLREENKLKEYSDLLYDSVFGEAFKKLTTQEQFSEFFVPILKNAQTSVDQRRQVEVLKHANSTDWANTIKVPTVVIASAEDLFASPSEAQALAKLITENGTSVDYVLIKNSGHSTLIEQLQCVYEIFQEKCPILTASKNGY